MPAVHKRHGLTLLNRGNQRDQRRFSGPYPGFDDHRWFGIHLHPSSTKFQHRTMSGAGQLWGIPQPGGERYRGSLIRLKIDVRQLIVSTCDAVALACVEPRCAASLQRDAQVT
jgi:hypothetical protein